jgi:hypothetical protein
MMSQHPNKYQNADIKAIITVRQQCSKNDSRRSKTVIDQSTRAMPAAFSATHVATIPVSLTVALESTSSTPSIPPFATIFVDNLLPLLRREIAHRAVGGGAPRAGSQIARTVDDTSTFSAVPGFSTAVGSSENGTDTCCIAGIEH